ncbi:outer membrane beta-barrel protein [Acidisarcina polymorpha]|uniref:outer membrane beta-barrel protein n=1 Tax=Acidisarcina polymorpha TaxID=2211140 RepID=UPI0013753163|nr:outer membrane beta-barrel protein [Acidisarcina polymorpha]
MSFLKKSGVVVSIAVLSVVSLHAQAPSPTESSSADYRFLLSSDELGGLEPAPAAGGQYGGQSTYPDYHGRWSHLAIEGGGGFTAPLGNSSGDLTYGWNFRGGLGWNFSKRFALLGEYEFDRNKIPAAILQQVGEPGGNVHTWSLTLDPVWNYKTSGRVGGYVTGGGGFYRKLTSFTEPALAQGVYCDFFYCYPYYYTTNVTVSHYSSNQGGLNIGTGLTFGRWENAKFFAEARYEWLATPGRNTQIIPVTFGLRW